MISPNLFDFFLKRYFKTLLFFQKSHFMYFEKMSVYPWWWPLHIPGWQQPGLRPRGCPDRPSKCWAPSRAGFRAVSFSEAAWSWGGGGGHSVAVSCGPGQGSRGEHLSVLRTWLVLTPGLPVTWSSTWQPCRSSILLVLQVGKAPAIVHWEG